MGKNKVYNHFLNALNKEEWFSLFEEIFINNSFPKPLPFKIDYPDELFIKLYKIILESDNYSLLTTYQLFLVEYYFSIPLFKKNYEKIYLLHRVFAELKSYNATYQKLFNQFFENILIDKYYNDINLQTSLLSLLIELPNIEEFDLTTQLHNTISKTSDYSYYYVSLKYFIRHRTINEYIDYFSSIVRDIRKSNKLIVNLLTESLIDFRDYYGSFQKLYEYIDWERLFKYNPTLIFEITTRITYKYLQKGKLWYDNDHFAVLFKIYINSIKYPPPLKVLEAKTLNFIEKKFRLNKIENYIKKPLSLRNFWMDYAFKIATDNNSLFTDKNPTTYIYLVNNNKYELGNSLLSYYKEEFNIDKRELLVTSPNKIFENIVFETSVQLQKSPTLKAEIKKQKIEKEKELFEIGNL